MISKYRLRGYAARALLLAASIPSFGAEIPWQKGPFVYEASQKRLPDLLIDLATSQGLSAVVDPDIEGQVTAHFKTPPSEMLKLIASTYNLTWYYDGASLYFYRASAMQTRMIRNAGVSVQRLQSTLERLQIYDARFPLKRDDGEGAVLVTGPKRYVELVEEAAQLLAQRSAPPETSGAVELRVFPLRYAWAQDKTVNNGSSQLVIPGVASTLRSLFRPSQSSGQPRLLSAERVKELSANRSVTSALLGKFEVPPDGTEAYRQYDAERSSGRSEATSLPQFQADGRLNAVLVRDVSTRMSGYEKLIRTLDTKPGLVEIEARIFDIQADVVERLGVEWSATGNRLSGNFSGRSPTGGGLSPGELLNAAIPGATVSSTLVRRGAASLMATVNALEQDGKARVVSQPKVLTIDNVEATLSDMQTFHVRVAGNLSAELFNVTAGTKLRVTPLIVVGDDGKRQVKLVVHAEDGALSPVMVDQLPVVHTRNIDTQALINEGESLLIGGLNYESDTNIQSGVPGLSKVPLIGGLFRQRDVSKVRIERLYLITPRVVSN